jgi:FkbM family methyltransferase
MSRLAFCSLFWLLASCHMREDPPRSEPAPSVRWVFIDGGANVGQTVLAFEKSTLFAKHAWSVVSFEPNPELVPLIPKRPFLTVEPKAMWIEDEPLEFEFSEDVTLGGSVMPTVVKFPTMKKVQVEAIDFGQWLAHNYRKEDVVYVKLDIEGAEYPVLEHMLRDGTMSLVDRLYVEFHGIQQATAEDAGPGALMAIQKKDYELVQAITGLGIAVSLHETHEPQGSYFDFDPTKYGQPW